jgi:predicted house-cleaning NTP pyrophosphatase (Maf/HAM1 superfamily)
MPNWTGKGGFKPGQSGNPKGAPKSKRRAAKRGKRIEVEQHVLEPVVGADPVMVLVTIQQLARAKTVEAIQALTDALQDRSYRVAAAIALLDRGWGRPAQAVDVNVRKTVREMSDEELMAIAAGGTRVLAPPDAPVDVLADDDAN